MAAGTGRRDPAASIRADGPRMGGHRDRRARPAVRTGARSRAMADRRSGLRARSRPSPLAGARSRRRLRRGRACDRALLTRPLGARRAVAVGKAGRLRRSRHGRRVWGGTWISGGAQLPGRGGRARSGRRIVDAERRNDRAIDRRPEPRRLHRSAPDAASGRQIGLEAGLDLRFRLDHRNRFGLTGELAGTRFISPIRISCRRRSASSGRFARRSICRSRGWSDRCRAATATAYCWASRPRCGSSNSCARARDGDALGVVSNEPAHWPRGGFQPLPAVFRWTPSAVRWG